MTNQPILLALPIMGTAAAAAAIAVPDTAAEFATYLTGAPVATSPAEKAPVTGPVVSISPAAVIAPPSVPTEHDTGGTIIVVSAASRPSTGKAAPETPLSDIPTPSALPARVEPESPTPPDAAPQPALQVKAPPVAIAPAAPMAPKPEAGTVTPRPTKEKAAKDNGTATKTKPRDETAAVLPGLPVTPVVVQPDRSVQRPVAAEPAHAVYNGPLPISPRPAVMEIQSGPQDSNRVAFAPDAPPVDLAPATAQPLPHNPRGTEHAAPVTLTVRAGHFGEELGLAIARVHGNARPDAPAETLMLRLDPPEHGRIEVTLTFEDGAPLRASVAATNPATLDMLRRESGELFRALGQAGVGTDPQSLSFGTGAHPGHQHGRHQPMMAAGRDPDPVNDAGFAATLIEAPQYRPLRRAVDLIT